MAQEKTYAAIGGHNINLKILGMSNKFNKLETTVKFQHSDIVSNSNANYFMYFIYVVKYSMLLAPTAPCKTRHEKPTNCGTRAADVLVNFLVGQL